MSGADQIGPASLDRALIFDRAFRLYEDRRRRARAFGEIEVLQEPSWDILLYVAGAMATDRRPLLSAVCDAACTAPTSALRHIQVLLGLDLLTQAQDGTKCRLSLSAKGEEAMLRYLATI